MNLWGDPSKAKAELGWNPQKTSFEELVARMVAHDMKKVAVERAEEQAKDFGHSVKREMAFLTVHGMLHLLGYDHMEEADRLEMEKEQRYVMEQLGISRNEGA